jgi:hypothetical protein
VIEAQASSINVRLMAAARRHPARPLYRAAGAQARTALSCRSRPPGRAVQRCRGNCAGEPNDAHAAAARGDQQASHHAAGPKTVAVTAGYIAPDARREFFAHMDAGNVDLKAFTEDFYRTVFSGHLEGVLDTLVYLKQETSVWFEITTLLIPGENDSEEEINALNRVTEISGPTYGCISLRFIPTGRCVTSRQLRR